MALFGTDGVRGVANLKAIDPRQLLVKTLGHLATFLKPQLLLG
jgi:phosphomannomutase